MPNDDLHRILIATGGTGGHVIPAFSLYQHLRKLNHRVVLSVDQRGLKFIDHHLDILTLPLAQPHRHLSGMLKFLWTFLHSLWITMRHMHAYKPDVVVSFGGYMTLPALISALIFRCPIVIHEQNSLLGRVNFWFARFAHTIALSMSLSHPKIAASIQHKSVETGLPIRHDIALLRIHGPRLLRQPHSHFNLVILGGSQGASFLDTCTRQALIQLQPKHQKQLCLHHQCRLENQADLKQFYEKSSIAHHLTPYIDDMAQVIKCADLIVARSGASTLCEISLVGKAALFVPYPHSADDHQTFNAKWVTQQGRGWWRSQDQITPEWLSAFISYHIDHPAAGFVTAEKMRQTINSDPLSALTHIILKTRSARINGLTCPPQTKEKA